MRHLRPLDDNQRAELERLNAQNARWASRPRSQRLLYTGGALAGAWAVMALCGWLVSTRVGTSAAGIMAGAVSAALLAAMLLPRALWPTKFAEWSVRAGMPRTEDLDRPFLAFGDINPDRLPPRRPPEQKSNGPPGRST